MLGAILGQPLHRDGGVGRRTRQTVIETDEFQKQKPDPPQGWLVDGVQSVSSNVGRTVLYILLLPFSHYYTILLQGAQPGAEV